MWPTRESQCYQVRHFAGIIRTTGRPPFRSVSLSSHWVECGRENFVHPRTFYKKLLKPGLLAFLSALTLLFIPVQTTGHSVQSTSWQTGQHLLDWPVSQMHLRMRLFRSAWRLQPAMWKPSRLSSREQSQFLRVWDHVASLRKNLRASLSVFHHCVSVPSSGRAPKLQFPLWAVDDGMRRARLGDIGGSEARETTEVTSG